MIGCMKCLRIHCQCRDDDDEMTDAEAIEKVDECLTFGKYIPRGGDVYVAFLKVLNIAKHAKEANKQ